MCGHSSREQCRTALLLMGEGCGMSLEQSIRKSVSHSCLVSILSVFSCALADAASWGTHSNFKPDIFTSFISVFISRRGSGSQIMRLRAVELSAQGHTARWIFLDCTDCNVALLGFPSLPCPCLVCLSPSLMASSLEVCSCEGISLRPDQLAAHA